MSVHPIKRHGDVPKCAGDPQEYGLTPECRLRTKHIVIGSDVIDGRLAMVIVGACPLHRPSIEEWVSLPYGAFTVEATPEALASVVRECDEQQEQVYVLERERNVA